MILEIIILTFDTTLFTLFEISLINLIRKDERSAAKISLQNLKNLFLIVETGATVIST